MPQVSVIIPTYNGTTRFVEEAVHSILNQTLQDFKLIVVDDTSTDGTLDVVHTLIPSNQVTQYVSRPVNGGPSAARNEGARVAKGTFLAFLDQDDLWAPTFLEELFRLLRNTTAEIGAAYTDRWDITGTGKRFRYVCGYQSRLRYTRIAVALSKGRHCMIQGMLLKRQAFEVVGGFDEQLRTGEDNEFLTRFHQRYDVKHLPKPLYSYRKRYGVSAHQDTAPLSVQLDNRLYRLQKQASLCQHDSRLRQAFQAELAEWYYEYGKYTMMTERDRRKARYYFTASFYMRFTLKNLIYYLRSYLPCGR